MQHSNFSQPLLEISLLGRFQAKIDGVPVDERSWGRRSAKSLVKLLALKPFHALHREQIMDLLWTEETPETALNNLNKAIYEARRALEPNLTKGSDSRFLLTQKKQIILDSPGSLFIDLDEFERLANYALKNNDLKTGQKAVELYRGELLIEDIYEDWIYARRESMQILFRKTATKVAGFYAAENNHQASIEILKKLVDDDASDEHVHLLLMRAYAETGSKYQALKQFEQCRAALRALGIEPEPETIRLEQSIKRGEILPTKNEHKSAPAESIAPKISTPRITPLTFQNGIIKSAKFMPGGETVLISAAWEGGDLELYKMSLETNEMRRLGIKNAEILAVASSGKMAVAFKSGISNKFNNPGTLAITDSSGELSRKHLKNIYWADWHPSEKANSSLPDEKFLAVVRDRKGRNCLEYPIGNVIYETGGWLSHPRFSADGKKIAFIEHPIFADDEGYIVLIDLEDKNLKKRILTQNWLTIFGLAWRKDEIWFTASDEAKTRTINAVDLKGVERLIYRGIGRLKLHDFSESGSALVTDDKNRNHTSARHASDHFERDLSWHEYTIPRDITDDGKKILIEEGGISSGIAYLSYVRNIDGSSTKLIGSGAPIAFSPDEKYALVRIPSPHNHLSLIDVETKAIKKLESDSENSLIYSEYACFFPDGKRILFPANKLNSGTKLYFQNISGGNPVCLTPDQEGIVIESQVSLSPDGEYIVLKNAEDQLSLYRISDGTYSPLKNLDENFSFVRWCGDGENLFIQRHREIPAIVYKYNPAAGTMEKWLELMPRDSAGVNQILNLKLTPDGKTYVYSFKRQFSDLYLMEDL